MLKRKAQPYQEYPCHICHSSLLLVSLLPVCQRNTGTERSADGPPCPKYGSGTSRCCCSLQARICTFRGNGWTLRDTFVLSIKKAAYLCQVLICQTCPPHWWGPHLLNHSGFLEKENAIITHNHRRETLINNKLFNAIKAVPLKKSPLNSGGGETNGESNFTMDFMTISKAFRPYCNQDRWELVTAKQANAATSSFIYPPCCQS